MIDVGLKKKFKLAIRKGHNESARGAKAILDEVTENTKVLNEFLVLAKEIKNLEVLNCSAPKSVTTVNGDLRYGVDKANSWGADAFVSIHFNKVYSNYKGTIGTEVWTYGTPSARAKNIQKELVKLGFTNRGCKKNPEFYELRATKMDSVIVEVCFIEATGDVDLYRKLGPKAVAKAILEGILGKAIGDTESSTPTPSKPSATWENYITGDSVKKLQKELNTQFKAGLAVDGYFGDATISKLVIVKKGAKGNLSKIIQERLTAKKFNVGKAGCDGDFGAGTERAVKELQKVNKLSIDGIVGVNTWKALYKK